MKAQILIALLAISLVASTGYLLMRSQKDVNVIPIYPVPVFKGLDYEVNAIAVYHYYSEKRAQYVVYYTTQSGQFGNVTTNCMSNHDIQEIEIDAGGILLKNTITSVKQIYC